MSLIPFSGNRSSYVDYGCHNFGKVKCKIFSKYIFLTSFTMISTEFKFQCAWMLNKWPLIPNNRT